MIQAVEMAICSIAVARLCLTSEKYLDICFKISNGRRSELWPTYQGENITLGHQLEQRAKKHAGTV